VWLKDLDIKGRRSVQDVELQASDMAPTFIRVNHLDIPLEDAVIIFVPAVICALDLNQSVWGFVTATGRVAGGDGIRLVGATQDIQRRFYEIAFGPVGIEEYPKTIVDQLRQDVNHMAILRARLSACPDANADSQN
jgi:hypothetical protein